MLNLAIDTRAFAFPDIPLPEVWRVRQKVDAPTLQDVAGAAREAARALFADPRLEPGAKVAVGVGSRGISNLVTVVRTVVEELKRGGCDPFLVPAMGSHGGATAEGQEGILRDYGITAASVGAPIRATMEVQQIASLPDGYPVYFDCNALAADAVVVINRIKPHTDFMAEIESGLSKMLAIGLGKRTGADTIHRFGADGLRRIMPAVARALTDTVPVVGGVALIENPYGETAEIHGLLAEEIGRRGEKRLLARARELMPKLPFEELDVLVVDEMGKDVSGSGLDTHVIGRLHMPSIPEAEWHGPRVRIVCALDITDASHGNAAGLGLADMVTRRLMERVDLTATFINHRTSQEGGAYRGRLPIILEDAAACVQAALGMCGRGRPEQARLARIRNTKYVDTLEVSGALLAEAQGRPDLQILEGPYRLDFRPLG